MMVGKTSYICDWLSTDETSCGQLMRGTIHVLSHVTDFYVLQAHEVESQMRKNWYHFTRNSK